MNKKVITHQHYLNTYKGENQELTKVMRFKEQCREFVKSIEPTFVAVYRPKKSRINYKNVDNLMQETIARYSLLDFRGSLESIYYTVEEDRYKKSMHMNIIGKGENVNALQLATAMKRNRSEILHFEPIHTLEGLSIYVHKHIAKKGINLGLQGYVTTEQAVDEQLYGVRNYKLEHPNKEYHHRAKFLMEYKYGWSKHPTVVI